MAATADLCDSYPALQVAAPILRSFGGVEEFFGPIATVSVDNDNTSVRLRLEEAGAGRVLVVDGQGSLQCALVGDRLAQLAFENGWSGVVVHGCIRDSAAISRMALGVKALAAMPRKSEKRGPGRHDVPVTFAGVIFRPGAWLYADADGVVVAEQSLD